MATTALWRRGFLRTIYLANSAGATFLARIQSYLTTRFDGDKSGTFFTGTSANGVSLSFAATKGLSPSEVSETLEYLYELYETELAALTTEANPSPTDAQIFAAMLTAMPTIKRIVTDHSTAGGEFVE